MNSSRIEEIAVAAINMEVLRSDYLANDIPVNDKTPSWDGEIWVYDNPRKTKDKLFGKVPVQVKGKKVLKISKEAKYPIKKVDLENYYKNGGVLFFLVEIQSIDQTQIFYLDLLPIDLKEILANLDSKKSVTKTFKKLGPESRGLEFICRNFILHSRKQGSSVLIDKDFDYDYIKLKIFTPSQEDFQNQLLEYGTYAYGHIEKLDLDIPLYKIQLLEIEEDTELWVGIKDEKRYTDIVRVIKKQIISLKFGQSFEVILPKDFYNDEGSKEPFKINFKEKGSIQDRIKDAKFMLEIISNKSINISGSIIELNRISDESKIQGLSRHINKLEEILETFNRLNINFNEDLEILTERDWNTINALVQIILHKNYGPIKPNKKDPFLRFRFANINIILFATTVMGEKMVYNLFNFEALKNHLKSHAILEDNSQSEEISPFLMINPTYLLELKNFDHCVVESSFKSIEYKSDLSATPANNYMLQILNYYDNHIHRSELLTLTFNIFDYLEKLYPDNITYFINKMQVVKRMRKFSDQEKEELIERKLQYGHMPEIMCAFFILLNSKIEFEVYFKKLPKNIQEKFYTFPIYNLTKSWYSEGP